MAIGMTYEQYWYGDPLMVRAFYKAEQLRRKRMNEKAWLHGLYVYRALDATVGNIVRKSGTELAEYPRKPLDMGDEAETEKEEREDQEALWAQAYMSNMVLAGKNWKKE